MLTIIHCRKAAKLRFVKIAPSLDVANLLSFFYPLTLACIVHKKEEINQVYEHGPVDKAWELAAVEE